MIGLILAAAGSGRRFGSSIPKQFLPFGGIPVYQHSLKKFSPWVGTSVLTIPVGWEAEIRTQLKSLRLEAPVEIVTGGPERQDSVANALLALPPEVDWVLVHDAARPFVTEALIRRMVEVSRSWPACVPGLPVTETVKEVDSAERVVRTLDRSQLRLIQTPQAFCREILEEALASARKRGIVATDEAALVEQIGYAVHVVPGEPENRKLTWPTDLEGLSNQLPHQESTS